VLLAAALACLPMKVSAVTLDQVVAMTKAGVSDAVILELIAREKMLLTIAPDQVVELQRAGVSDSVILALLKSGVAVEQRAPIDAAALTPAGPIVAFVGHGAERPNTTAYDFAEAPRVVVVPVPVPYGLPFGGGRVPRRRAQAFKPVPERTANPLLCVERVSVSPSPFAPALTRATECPAR